MAAEYGVSLIWQKLKHLVLADKAAVDAVLGVAAYLESEHKPGKEIFCLRNDNSGRATFELASNFVRIDGTLSRIWKDQKEDANMRVENHWQEVQRKQKLAEQLRDQLFYAEEHRDALAAQVSRALQQLYTYGNDYNACRRAYDRLVDESNKASSKCNDLRAKLQDAEKAPPPVIQPLPKDETAALVWVFHMHMPIAFRRLSRAAFLAQQLLLPAPQHSDGINLMAPSSAYDLCVHYNHYQQPSQYVAQPKQHPGTSGRVELQSCSAPPIHVGPKHVDEFYSREDGVWYPDSLSPHLAWKGSGSEADRGQHIANLAPCGYFNPFGFVPNISRVLTFTECLPTSVQHLQWAMPIPGSIPQDRGNMAMAHLDQKPSWLSKPGFLDFGSLRAYPHIQLRRLCAILHERTLPLGMPAVVTLVRQCLFHIGTLAVGTGSGTSSTGCGPYLEWRTQWAAEGEVLEALGHELQLLAEELMDSKREHQQVLLLGEMAAYLADWSPQCKQSALCFAAMTSRHADDLDSQIMATAGNDLAQQKLQARQCELRMLSLICFSAGPLDTPDIARMLRLMVLIKHGHVFLDDPATCEQLAHLHALCHDIMSKHAATISEVAGRNPGILTAAVASVLQHAPSNLPWQKLSKPLPADGTCVLTWLLHAFEAVSTDGHLYSMNVLDGTILLDGCPPSRLPKSILGHGMYKRVFGDCNFEVAMTAGGVLQTIKPIKGRFYNFYLAKNQLVATEEDSAQSTCLELLDVGSNGLCSPWGTELPVRLRSTNMHSHWLCRKHGSILLRQPFFQAHQVHFLARLLPQGAPLPRFSSMRLQHDLDNGSNSHQPQVPTSHSGQAQVQALHCWRVPLHLQAVPWLQLLGPRAPELTDHLVLPCGSYICEVLSKMEDLQYIHVYRSVPEAQACSPPAASSSVCPSQSSKKKKKQRHKKQHRNQHQQHQIISPTFLFELPRYDLDFRLAGDELESLDFSGHVLGPQQQLVLEEGSSTQHTLHTLPGLQQYLVLNRRPGHVAVGARKADVVVLVPNGRVRRGVEGPTGGRGRCGHVQVEVDGRCGAKLQVHAYEVHSRFGDLRASSIAARLQLAALYTATSTLLAEPARRCTGEQMAMRLLRHSWMNRPLPAEELGHLHSIYALSRRTPGLKLLVRELMRSAQQLSHLYIGTAAAAATAAATGTAAAAALELGSDLDTDAGTCYLHDTRPHQNLGWRGFESNPRMLLTPIEKSRALGAFHKLAHYPLWLKAMKRDGQLQLGVPSCSAPLDIIPSIEAWLSSIVLTSAPKSSAPPPYPFLAPSPADTYVPKKRRTGPGSSTQSEQAQTLEAEMHRELHDSWHVYHNLPTPGGLTLDPKDLTFAVQETQAKVVEQRKMTEQYFLQNLADIPESTGIWGTAFRLLRMCGGAPQPGLLDLAQSIIQHPQALLPFNPFLSDTPCTHLVEAAKHWGQLCVLEDRLRRIAALAAAGDESVPLLIQELQCKRTWDVAQHPQWLALEVEGQLQIRPAQYAIAHHLMNNPGAVDQLNMGEGKTRVILPMLATTWADGHSLVRLNIPSTLLEEAYTYLHSFLTASLLNRKLFLQPFHRDVAITHFGARSMRAALAYCQKVGGILLVAPEHRASLQLKRDELLSSDLSTCHELDKLAAIPYIDLVDEVDMLLHHKFQLVYACGAQAALPALEQRTAAVQALMHVITALADSGSNSGAGSSCSTCGPPGAFCKLRLIPSSALEAVELELCTALAKQVIADPPYEMRWLQTRGSDKVVHERLVACLVDPSASAQDLMGDAWDALEDEQHYHLLALRGLLAGRLLLHCLQRRHQVDFGISHLPSARKRLAVPFRAADMPSERSEWAQPDVAILLTTISYYHAGLTAGQLQQALELLLRMGPNAQRDHYARWLKGSKKHMHAGHLAVLDDVRKLDASNAQQLLVLHQFYSHNMAAIDFWLRFCVFKEETKQFSYRLSCSAWHLAENTQGRIVGFSGTNDNHRLLPLQVHQAVPVEASLQATNGKMLQVILDNPEYRTLQIVQDAASGNPKPVWQCLLEHAVAHKADALIDCGALLAGISNRAAAEYVLHLLSSSRHQGVCFFEVQAQPPTWMVLEARGRCLPLARAPVAERNTFAIFDDAHCRGADLKLHQDAVGMVTLGPGMTKDKLMQAAGRMRLLGRGQKLRFVGTQEVTDKVCRSSSGAGGGVRGVSTKEGRPCLSSRDVLRWVMANSVEAAAQGVVEWAKKGVHFVSTQAQQGEPLLQQEHYELGELYGGARVQRPMRQEVRLLAQALQLPPQAQAAQPSLLPQQHQQQQQQPQKQPQQQLQLQQQLQQPAAARPAQLDLHVLLSRICERGSFLGGERMVVSSRHGTDEECERELEKEEEEEEENERQIPRTNPMQEKDWNYKSALAATSARHLAAHTQLVPLPSMIGAHLPAGSLAAGIAWSWDVLCTANFVNTIQPPTVLEGAGPAAGGEHLRPVGALLLFPEDATACLVSEREADALLLLAWRAAASTGRTTSGSKKRIMARAGIRSGGISISSSSSSSHSWGPVLVPLCHAQQAYDSGGSRPLLVTPLKSSPAHTAFPWSVFVTALVHAQLFNGGTTYGTDSPGGEAMRGWLHTLVHGKRSAVEELVDMRGKMPYLPRSHLERASGDAN